MEWMEFVLINTKRNYSNFSDDEVEIIKIISTLCSILSIASSLFIFSLFWFFKEIRNFNLELVIWYSISSTLYLITPFFPFNPNEKPTWCAIQAFTLTWFQIACHMWTCIIGYTAFISVIKKEHIEKHKCKYRILFLGVAFIVSGCLASLILITNSYGSSGGWCWMDLYIDQRPIVFKLVLFYFCIEWFFIILNCFFIFKVIAILNENIKHQNLMKVYSYMKWYPIIQIICSIPATTNRLLDVIIKCNNFVLMCIQAVMDYSQGLFITIIFILSPQIRYNLRICCLRLFCKEIKKDFADDTSFLYSNRERDHSIPTSDFTMSSDLEVGRNQNAKKSSS